MAFFRAFVVLLFLPCFLGACAKDEPLYAVYTVVAEMDEALADTLSAGDALVDACGKESAGEVLAVTREGALAEDAHGVYTRAERVRVKLSVGVNGKQTERGILVGTMRLCAGERVYLLGKARIEGLCVRVRAL